MNMVSSYKWKQNQIRRKIMTCIICDKKLSKIEEDMNMCILCGVGY